MINKILRSIVAALLALRYRVEVHGLDKIVERGTENILFLPSHQALIDPIIMMTVLHKRFVSTRALADIDGGINQPGLRWLAERFGARFMPAIAKRGPEARAEIERVLDKCIAGLQQHENLLMYPAGHILRCQREEIGANSAVETILHQAPEVRVVLVRIRGLWGSSFSNLGPARDSQVGLILKNGLIAILKNAIFFTPRRPVTIEFVEPDDLPRTADRQTINRYLEDFYNQEPLPRNTYVPYTIWERSRITTLPEPETAVVHADTGAVPSGTRELVTRHLQELTGVAVLRDEAHLVNDLGMDSLARAELLVWLEQEFGFPQTNVDALRTVGDILLAACGEAISGGMAELNPVPPTWFRAESAESRLTIPAGATVPEVFLTQARRTPDRVIIADQSGGAKTYRDIVTGVFALLPLIKNLPGDRVGIMLPASVVANVVYLTVLFAGKTPVMINWTVGWRNLRHGLELTGVQQVITAQQLVSRVEAQGTDLSAVKENFVYLETLAGSLTKWQKIKAGLAGFGNWSALRRATIDPTAAILFTSGSENLPKAVPLTHDNVLTNLRDVLTMVTITTHDRLLGMLPPFHSFGLTGNMLFALCGGMQTVYHANPTEGAMLARLIDAYKVSMLVGTPTFLYGIVRGATRAQLSSMRLAVTGAEECPARVYDAMAERCPQATVLEGYGITECSPIVALNDEKAPKPGAIGLPLPSVNTAIVNVETGEPVARGEQGMLLLRGPSIFAGYFGDGAPNPFVEHVGQRWYRTGDLVSEDVDGVLRFRGRLKRFVKLGGEMVSLPAIEAVLQKAVEMQEDGPVLAVVATADVERPELVLFTTVPLDRETANRHIREAGLSALHNIRRVINLPEIPVLGTGKTDYRTLQAQLAGDLAGMR